MALSEANKERNREQDQAHLRWLVEAAQTLDTYPRFSAFEIADLINTDPEAVLPGSLTDKTITGMRLAQAWSNIAPGDLTIERAGKFHRSVLAWHVRGFSQPVIDDHRLARKWAKNKGIPVNDRGRVNQETLNAYRAEAFVAEPAARKTQTFPSFDEVSHLISPEAARDLLAKSQKAICQKKVDDHIRALECSLAGTYTPLDCLILLDPVDRPLTGMELLTACAGTNTAVRAIIIRTGSTEATRQPPPEPTPEEKDHDTSSKLEHAIHVLYAIDISAKEPNKLVDVAGVRRPPVSTSLKRRAQALIEQKPSIDGHTGAGYGKALSPVFVDALRLVLLEQVGQSQADIIDGPYALLFQALDRGLADAPALTAMLTALNDPTNNPKKAAQAVTTAWEGLHDKEWSKEARKVLSNRSIRVSIETLTTVLQLRHQGMSLRDIGSHVDSNASSVGRWLKAAKEVLGESWAD